MVSRSRLSVGAVMALGLTIEIQAAIDALYTPIEESLLELDLP